MVGNSKIVNAVINIKAQNLFIANDQPTKPPTLD
jgi:hypothetical protein